MLRPLVPLLAALALAASAPAAPAQLLDGQWFKLVVSCDGSGLPAEATEAVKEKVKPSVHYAFFTLSEGLGIQYDITTYSPVEGGGWAADAGGFVTMMDPAETFVANGEVVVSRVPLTPLDGAPNIIAIGFNGPAKTKVKNEELVSASIKTLGATSYFTNESHSFIGRGKVTFTRVPLEKLPFEVALLAQAAPQREAGKTSAAPAQAAVPAPATAPQAP